MRGLIGKIITLITFIAGAIFGMVFSTKKGSEVRKKLEKTGSNEETAEVLANELGEVAQNFWTTVKGPLKKLINSAGNTVSDQTQQYSQQLKEAVDNWKESALKEVKGATKKKKKKTTKAKKTKK